MRRLIASLLTAASLCLGVPSARAALEDYPSVKLQGLDKSVGRTVTFEAKVGSTIQYGPLYIKIQACRKAPPIEKPESAAFLQIWEVPPGRQTSEWVFSGWMFASSPALSAMDHPVYDVWVLTCTGRDEAEVETTDEAIQSEENGTPATAGAMDATAAPDASTATDAATGTPPTDSEAEPAPASETTSVTDDGTATSAETPVEAAPDAADGTVPAIEPQTPSGAPYDPNGAYSPDGGATVRPAPRDTQMPETPAPRTGGTPGTAYEFMNRPNASSGRVIPRDNSTAYDQMR